MITIPMRPPHSDKQRDMITYPGNVAALAGRRFGKTDAYIQRIYRSMSMVPGLYWWVGLSWKSASMKRAWRIVQYYARRVLQILELPVRGHINLSKYEITIPGLGDIWFRTADNPSSLAGEGIRGAVVDEFTLMQEMVWTEYLEATLLDYGGWVAFSGVPKGKNWASNLWLSAASRPGWLQIQANTYENPFIKPERIDAIRQNAPERTFLQEYMAEIIDDAGGVFRRVMDAATVTEQTEPERGHEYIFGVDWGKSNDFTVITVLDTTDNALVYMDRFNQIDYTVQVNRLQALAERFKPGTIIAEKNSMGDPIIEQLNRRGLPVQPFQTTNASKANAIDALALAFERGDISIIGDPILIGELQAYEMERLPSGNMRYNAPAGMHDDCVMSLALAWHGVSSYMPAFL